MLEYDSLTRFNIARRELSRRTFKLYDAIAAAHATLFSRLWQMGERLREAFLLQVDSARRPREQDWSAERWRYMRYMVSGRYWGKRYFHLLRKCTFLCYRLCLMESTNTHEEGSNSGARDTPPAPSWRTPTPRSHLPCVPTARTPLLLGFPCLLSMHVQSQTASPRVQKSAMAKRG